MELQPLPPRSAFDDDALQIIEPLCAVFRRKLKSEGLKYTPERAQILDAVLQMDDVFQAEQLIEKLKKSQLRVSKATAYRTIKLLSDAGIIQQILFDADQSHYQLAYGKRSSGLLVDVDTKEITPIDAPEIAAWRDKLCRERGLKAEGHRFVIYARSKA